MRTAERATAALRRNICVDELSTAGNSLIRTSTYCIIWTPVVPTAAGFLSHPIDGSAGDGASRPKYPSHGPIVFGPTCPAGAPPTAGPGPRFRKGDAVHGNGVDAPLKMSRPCQAGAPVMIEVRDPTELCTYRSTLAVNAS